MRPQSLAQCLQAIADADYPKDRMEVIVVDDGGAPVPDSVTPSFAGPLPVRHVRQGHAGPAAARNRGAKLAQGDYLAFVDDDCRVSATWLRVMAGVFREHPDCAATGHTENLLTGNPFSQASQDLIGFLYARHNTTPDRARFLTSNNLVISSRLFHRVGGFDTCFPHAAGEDRDFCDRLLSAGHRLVYVPEAVVFHAHHLSMRSFLRQHFCYGRGAFRFHLLRSRRRRERIRLEPFRFYCALMGHAFKVCRGSKALSLLFLLGLTQIATGLGFARQRFQAPCAQRSDP
jgi:GT2 family glycosyltransferase